MAPICCRFSFVASLRWRWKVIDRHLSSGSLHCFQPLTRLFHCSRQVFYILYEPPSSCYSGERRNVSHVYCWKCLRKGLPLRQKLTFGEMTLLQISCPIFLFHVWVRFPEPLSFLSFSFRMNSKGQRPSFCPEGMLQLKSCRIIMLSPMSLCCWVFSKW